MNQIQGVTNILKSADISQAYMPDLKKEFKEVSRLLAAPAPSRSLESPLIAPIIKDALQANNSVYFGELHDDVNMKFLADNGGLSG